MFKLFNLGKPDNEPKSDPNLRERLNADMAYCGLDEDIQKGFLFFLGASLNIGANESKVDLSLKEKTEKEKIRVLAALTNFYSVSSGDFSDYGELKDWVFLSHIYTINHILFNVLNDEPFDLDDKLRKVSIVDGKEPIIIGKADLVEGFAEHYDGQSYNLNICIIEVRIFSGELVIIFQILGSIRKKATRQALRISLCNAILTSTVHPFYCGQSTTAFHLFIWHYITIQFFTLLPLKA
jgi:hypothetical protein